MSVRCVRQYVWISSLIVAPAAASVSLKQPRASATVSSRPRSGCCHLLHVEAGGRLKVSSPLQAPLSGFPSGCCHLLHESHMGKRGMVATAAPLWLSPHVTHLSTSSTPPGGCSLGPPSQRPWIGVLDGGVLVLAQIGPLDWNLLLDQPLQTGLHPPWCTPGGVTQWG